MILLALAVSVAATAAQSQDAVYARGVKQVVVDEKGRQGTPDVVVRLTPTAVVIEQKKKVLGTIDYGSITGITYDRRSRVRVMAPTWQRRQQHFVTIQYKDEFGGDFVEFELSKDIAANFVNVLEARSGKKIDKIAG